jgi:hypothetical protein
VADLYKIWYECYDAIKGDPIDSIHLVMKRWWANEVVMFAQSGRHVMWGCKMRYGNTALNI